MKTDSPHEDVRQEIAGRFAWYRDVAEQRGEQLRQADIQIARLCNALEDIAQGGDAQTLERIAKDALRWND